MRGKEDEREKKGGGRMGIVEGRSRGRKSKAADQDVTNAN